MKERIISGTVIAIITILAVLLGGHFLNAILAFVIAWGSYEAIKIRKEKFNILLYIILAVSCACIWLLPEYATNVILFELIILLTYGVFTKKENLYELSYILLMTVLIGYGVFYISYTQGFSKWLLGYVILIAYITDAAAYFVGRKYGKHKLIERVSPKKTIEGALGGWACGCALSIIWALIFNWFYMDYQVILITSFCLPVISQIGDLVFSMIKRFFIIKDFSELIPGHGGILDRLDSLLFCIIFFGALVSILA